MDCFRTPNVLIAAAVENEGMIGEGDRVKGKESFAVDLRGGVGKDGRSSTGDTIVHSGELGEPRFCGCPLFFGRETLDPLSSLRRYSSVGETICCPIKVGTGGGISSP